MINWRIITRKETAELNQCGIINQWFMIKRKFVSTIPVQCKKITNSNCVL